MQSSSSRALWKAAPGSFSKRPEDIKIWKNEGLLAAQEAERLDLVPAPQRKTLEQAMEEYKATWEVSPGEAKNREGRITVIKNILGAKTPIVELNYGHGEHLKTKLRERKVKVVTIQNYLQDLKRCFRHQVRLQVLPYNPFAELSADRVPATERPKQTRLNNAQVVSVLEKATKRLQKETGWPALHGWLLVFLLMLFGTGLRRKEAMLARWEHVDWENRFLVVPAVNAKDGDERRVGLGRRLFNELSARRQEEGFILPRYYPTTVSRAVIRHFAACGLPMRLVKGFLCKESWPVKLLLQCRLQRRVLGPELSQALPGFQWVKRIDPAGVLQILAFAA